MTTRHSETSHALFIRQVNVSPEPMREVTTLLVQVVARLPGLVQSYAQMINKMGRVIGIGTKQIYIFINSSSFPSKCKVFVRPSMSKSKYCLFNFNFFRLISSNNVSQKFLKMNESDNDDINEVIVRRPWCEATNDKWGAGTRTRPTDHA